MKVTTLNDFSFLLKDMTTECVFDGQTDGGLSIKMLVVKKIALLLIRSHQKEMYERTRKERKQRRTEL